MLDTQGKPTVYMQVPIVLLLHNTRYFTILGMVCKVMKVGKWCNIGFKVTTVNVSA